MNNREHNLTNSFLEYLNFASSNSYLNDNTIKLSIYGALNEIDEDENTVKLMQKMSLDYEHIAQLIEAEARCIDKNEKRELNSHRRDSNDKYFTPQEIAATYPISEQAIRKACKEGRLPFEEGKGKIKYQIRKYEIEKYMLSAKGKRT